MSCGDPSSRLVDDKTESLVNLQMLCSERTQNQLYTTHCSKFNRLSRKRIIFLNTLNQIEPEHCVLELSVLHNKLQKQRPKLTKGPTCPRRDLFLVRLKRKQSYNDFGSSLFQMNSFLLVIIARIFLR